MAEASVVHGANAVVDKSHHAIFLSMVLTSTEGLSNGMMRPGNRSSGGGRADGHPAGAAGHTDVPVPGAAGIGAGVAATAASITLPLYSPSMQFGST